MEAWDLNRDVTNEKGLERVRFACGFSFLLSKDLGLKYKVVLQLPRLCLLANFPASTITLGGGGGLITNFEP